MFRVRVAAAIAAMLLILPGSARATEAALPLPPTATCLAQPDDATIAATDKAEWSNCEK